MPRKTLYIGAQAQARDFDLRNIAKRSRRTCSWHVQRIQAFREVYIGLLFSSSSGRTDIGLDKWGKSLVSTR